MLATTRIMNVQEKQQQGAPANGDHHDASFDFQHDVTWRIFRVMAEFTEGLEFIAGLKRPVTIFGSGRTPRTDRYYGDAVRLAKKLGREGYTIITGGGPGIMEAANRGAVEAKAPSIGLNIQLPYEQRMNKFVKKAIGFYYFFTRKSMLSTSAQAYVFFPGGFGTMDEFFTIITLMETKKIEARPIVLYGKEFWTPFVQYIHDKMFVPKSIDADDMHLFTIVDNVEDALALVHESKERKYTFM